MPVPIGSKFHDGKTMKIGKAGTRGRAFKLSKKARFEVAFQQIRRELREQNSGRVLSPPPAPGFGRRHKAERPLLTLPTRR
jgi:hypothetical protein